MGCMHYKISFFIAILAMITSPASLAQTVGGVFGPVIKEGDRTAEYRLAFVPEAGSDNVRFVHRLHYQYALNDRWRLRGVLQGSDVETGAQEFNFFQGELQWQFLKKNSIGLASALRFDGRVTEGDDGADLISLNSTTQWDFDQNWRAVGVILVGRELGNEARDGVRLETRVSLTRKITNRYRLGLESFNVYGNSTNGFGPIADQSHSFGPVATASLGQGWSLLGGTLFGLTRAAPGADFRFWVTKSF